MATKEKAVKFKSVWTKQLVPYANNARQHSDDQINQIAASIQEFGFLNPIIIDKSKGIIAGHGRVLAAEQLGLKRVPVIEAAHLTEAQKKAYILADNKIAENASWHQDMLRVELEALKELDFNLDVIGFDIDEIEDILNLDFNPGSAGGQGKLDELDPKMITCPHCGEEFDARKKAEG